MAEIDLVVPYVDSSDPNWQKLFDKYNPIKDIEIEAINAKNRFRGQGDFFKYWFRCVDKYLHWIHKIHFIVQSESQIPSWLDRSKVNIVYHKDFIPEEYLPTFNSTTIEMFLWNIKDLSEYFLYANDDIFPFGKLRPEYFFNFVKNKVKNNTSPITVKPGCIMYVKHCLNSYNLAYNKNLKEESMILPAFKHDLRPYIRSEMEAHFKANEKEILSKLSSFRENKNINVYYFSHCLIRDGLQEPRIDIKSRLINSNTSDVDGKMILNSGCNILAINDTDPNINIYEKFYLNNYFHNNFTFKSKYEL